MPMNPAPSQRKRMGAIALAVFVGCILWWSLGRLTTPTLDELTNQLLLQMKDPDANVRLTAIEELDNLMAGGIFVDNTSPPDAVSDYLADDRLSALASALIDALSDDNRAVRSAAVRAVRHFPIHGQGAIARLLQGLEAADTQLRLDAAFSLVELLEFADDPPASASMVVPVFVEYLRESSRFARQRAASSLGSLGWLGITSDEAVAELLMAAERDEDRFVRRDALLALGEIGQRLESVSPLIAAALDDPDVFTRLGAVNAAGYLGRKGEIFLPRIEAIKEKSGGLRLSGARMAIDRIRVDVALASLEDTTNLEGELNVRAIAFALDDPDRYKRAAAVMFLAQHGFQAGDWRAQLQNLRDHDPDVFVRLKARFAIEAMREQNDGR